jgi:hypothetical protein
MRKADCTAEQWATYTARAKEWYHLNRDKVIERTKAYNKTEKAVERRRAYDMRPDVKARRHERENGPEGKQYRKERWAKTKADPDKLSARYAATREFRTGMAADLFSQLIILQGNKCAICEKPFDKPSKGHRRAAGKSYPCADHCHDGGGPRGLLCHNCNTIEGHIRSLGFALPDYMQRLNNYLSNPPAKRVT